MSEMKKLSEEQMAAIFKRMDFGYYGVPAEGYLSPEAAQDVSSLLDHITAMEAEQRAGASRTASDAFEVGHANATFIEQQTWRIQALEHDNQLLNKIDDAVNAQAHDWGLSSLQDAILDAHYTYTLHRKVKS